MSLDPYARASWQGFTDLLRPPPDYRLDAAVGTSFGLSFDALVAGLLSMLGTDPEALAGDPVAGLIAATKLSDRIRLLVHAGSLSASATAVPHQLAALLEPFIVSMQPRQGLFHPKLWVLKFTSTATGTAPTTKMRVVVGSRNATRSSAFELGWMVEGEVGAGATAFGNDTARVLERYLREANSICERVRAIPGLLKTTQLRISSEGDSGVNLRSQGFGEKSLRHHLPASMQRGILVSPFLTPDFLRVLLDRTRELRVLSTPEAFNKLDPDMFEELEQRAVSQKGAVMYAVGEFGDEESGTIDGIHAKLLLFDEPKGASPVTFVGSANGTGAGWGVRASFNVELMAEIHPGLAIDHFVRDFMLDKKGRLKAWLKEYKPSDRSPISAETRLRDELVLSLRRIAALDFRMTYDERAHRLAIDRLAIDALPASLVADGAVVIECTPLVLATADNSWKPIRDLVHSSLRFEGVELADVSAFIVIRARFGATVVSRIALARLDLSASLAERRNDAARAALLENVDPINIMTALILGLSRLRPTAASTGLLGRAASRHTSVSQLVEAVTLERLLQAVAQDVDLVRSVRLLLTSISDESLSRFCDDLELASRGEAGHANA